MRIKSKTTKTIDIAYLQISAGVRHWEDSILNDIEDSLGKMPCIKDDCWCPIIEVDTGVIINWEQGNTAEVHYKVCDRGYYKFLDAEMKLIRTSQMYPPEILSLKDPGWCDYIILDIDENGKIKHWEPELIEDAFNTKSFSEDE